MRRARASGGDSRSHPYSISRRTAGTVPTFAKSALVFAGMVSIERFHVPSADCVSAIRSAGRYAYGSDPSSETTDSGSRAISVAARYFIGPDAFSRIQSSGKLSGSPAGTRGAKIDSSAKMGAVTGGAQRLFGLGKAPDDRRIKASSLWQAPNPI